jgi:hypothetical protein
VFSIKARDINKNLYSKNKKKKKKKNTNFKKCLSLTV